MIDTITNNLEDFFALEKRSAILFIKAHNSDRPNFSLKKGPETELIKASLISICLLNQLILHEDLKLWVEYYRYASFYPSHLVNMNLKFCVA